MVKKILVFVLLSYLPILIVLFSGCAGDEAYVPRISGVVADLHSGGQKKNYSTTQIRRPYKTYRPKLAKVDYSYSYSEPGWRPPSRVERGWDAIIIHHSATQEGSMASIDEYHRDVRGWDGIGYDFVIGNGHGSGNGQVETTFRWKQQRTGAHCKTDSSNWANREAVGICLIGNFDKSRPTYRQMASLRKLVRFLSHRYNIPENRIYGHKNTPGHSTVTDCPGKYFPMYSLKSSL